jgi:hypothetical protein
LTSIGQKTKKQRLSWMDFKKKLVQIERQLFDQMDPGKNSPQ